MIIDKGVLDELSAEAKASTRMKVFIGAKFR